MRPRRLVLCLLAAAAAASLALTQAWDGGRASAGSPPARKVGGAQSSNPAAAARFVALTPMATGNTIYVTTTAQGVADDGKCSLQEAIYSANFDFGVAPSSFNPIVKFDTGCEPGSGDDTIVLEAGKEYLMTAVLDDPYNPVGPAANPIVLSNMTIEANGARIVRSNPFRDFAGTNFRAFAVARRAFADPNDELGVAGPGTGSLTIRNAHIKGFTAKGGDGSAGGGGGMGAGGAIYVRDARVGVENCTFEDNGAGGGRGSAHLSGPGGGGGGMGGDGGTAQSDSFFPTPLPDGFNNVNFGSGPGGGGGGARADGGANGFTSQFFGGWATGTGGGGGGTLTKGEAGGSHVSQPFQNGRGGYRCGGAGGDYQDDGSSATCPGGGGGGGGLPDGCVIRSGGNAGNGHYGGGGGGGGYHSSNFTVCPYGRRGGRGGFGGGGGAGGEGDHGGDGGFGGGGGAGSDSAGDGGIYGLYGGDGSAYYGGGGAGLGGAIFSHGGTVTVWNSTFTGNYAVRGAAPGVISGFPGPAQSGEDAGGAIFTLNGKLEIYNSTISRNETTRDLGGVVVLGAYDVPLLSLPLPEPSASLTLHNTIIANNGVTTDGVVFNNANGECFAAGVGMTKTGSHNLITKNHPTSACPGVVQTGDPKLGPLQLNAPGLTPTMALDPTSPAIDKGTDLSAEGIIADQRGVSRPQGAAYDIGAYEANSAPLSAGPAIAPVTDEDAANSITITLTGTDAEGSNLIFTITDGPDNGTLGAVSAPVCSNGTCTASVTYTPAADYNGPDSFKFKVNDGATDSVETTVPITVNAVNDRPVVSAAPAAQTAQYSDAATPVTVTATDLETAEGSLTISFSGLPSGLSFTDGGVNVAGERVWTVSGTLQAPAGVYPVTASVTDSGDGSDVSETSSASFTVTVEKEVAVAAPQVSNPVSMKVGIAGGNASGTTSPVCFYITEVADGSPGDTSLIEATVSINAVGGGAVGATVKANSVTLDGGGVGAARTACFALTLDNAAVNVYEVTLNLGGGYYQGSGTTAFTVFDPSLGFVSGGGWVVNPQTGYRANFGVNIKYLKSAKAQGSVLYVEHRPDGDYKVKSNSLNSTGGVAILTVTGGAEAQVAGKATYAAGGVAEGNYAFVARVIDLITPGAADRFGLKLISPLGQVVTALTFDPVTLGGGNNQVPQKSK